MRGSGPSLSIQKASNGGHTMSLRMPDKPSKGGNIGNYQPPEERVYGAGDHEQMIGDLRKPKAPRSPPSGQRRNRR